MGSGESASGSHASVAKYITHKAILNYLPSPVLCVKKRNGNPSSGPSRCFSAAAVSWFQKKTVRPGALQTHTQESEGKGRLSAHLKG